MAKIKVKENKKKKALSLSLSNRNQKYIFQKLVLDPVRKASEKISVGHKLSELTCDINVFNAILETEARVSWEELTRSGRIRLPFKTVCPSFRIDESGDIFELKLTDNLVSLSNGTLDPELVPIDITTL